MRPLRHLFAALALVLLADAAAAERLVGVRGGLHPDKIRLVFDFEREVGYRATVDGQRLLLTFDQPDRFDFAPAQRSLRSRIGTPTLRDDGLGVVVPLAEPRRLEHFRVGTKVVLDLFPATAPAPAGPSPAADAAGEAARAAPGERVRLAVERRAETERLRFIWPRAVQHRIEQSEAGAVIRFARPGSLDLSALQGQPLALIESVQPRSGGEGLVVAIAFEPGAQVGTLDEGDSLVVDVMPPRRDRAVAPPAAPLALFEPAAKPATAETPSPAPPAGRAEAPSEAPHPAAAAEAGKGKAAPERGQANVTVSATRQPRQIDAVPGSTVDWPEPLQLRFDWSQETGAAAVQLGQALLLVFDRTAPGDLEARLRALDPALEAAVREPAEGATVLRLPLGPLVRAEVNRDADAWVVDLRVRAAKRSDRLQARVEPSETGRRLRFDVLGAGKVVPVADPAGGAPLLVVPLARPEQWVATPRLYQQFLLLPTAQGMAVRRLGEGVRLAVDATSVSLEADTPIVVSTDAPLAPDPDGRGAPPAPRLFDLAAWRGGPAEAFNERRRRLQAAVMETVAERRAIARLRLARFYFAHGLARESLGVLALIERENAELAGDPELLLLKAASSLLTGDYEDGTALLAHPALADEPEADLWRAALATVAQDWPVALAKFEPTAALIDDYPRPLRTRLRQWAAQAALGAGAPDIADAHLARAADDLVTGPERARQAYLEGRLAMARGQTDEALDAWRRVAGDAASAAAAAQARLALIDQAVQARDMDNEAAIAALEQLQFAWRGDAFELGLLTRLAELYRQQGEPREALRALRRAASYFPDSPVAERAAARMRELFAEIFSGAEEDRLAALDALSIYEEFRELTPAGPEGDRVIERLSDRLVDIDLLERAAALLQYQIDYRLSGADKARAGARLAVVRLLDRQPSAAIATLDATAAAGLPAAVENRRRLLRVQALADLGQPAEALALITGDDSREATQLRADVLWRQRDWQAAAGALARLLPKPPAPGEAIAAADSARVLNLAVALTLADMEQALADLAKSYGETMALGPHKEAFALLAGGAGTGRIASIAEELAKVDRVRDFIASYRERQRATQVSGLN